MIGLALDAGTATAAIQSDGGDFIFGPNTPMPDGGYREWLSAVPDLLDSLPGTEASMPVAVALPGIIRDETVTFTPVQHLEGRHVRRDLQSVLSREVSITGFGTALATWHAGSTDDTAPLAALWIGPQAPTVRQETGRTLNCPPRSRTSLTADNAGVAETDALRRSCRCRASRRITNGSAA
jgi:hypothetical protein